MTIEFLQGLKVEDIIEKNFQLLCEDEPVAHAFSHMIEKKVFEIPVVDEKKNFVGIMNYESLIRRRKIPLTSRVGHFLLSPPRLSLQDSLPEVSELFLSTDFQILPVLKADKLLGIVNRYALLKKATESKAIGDVSLSEIMSRSLITASAEERISSARAKMLSLDIQELPIVDDDGGLKGVLELNNLMEFLRIPRKRAAKGHISSEKITFDPKVKDVMRTNLFQVNENDSVREAVELMAEHRVLSVFVCEDNKLVGIVHPSDILELVARHKGRDGVHIQISGLEHEDPAVYDTMYQIIQKYMEKINKIHQPKLLNIHIITNSYHRDDTIFDVRVRLTTAKETLATTYESWNLYEAVDKCLAYMEREIIKKKEKRLHNMRGT